jgi:hypothetical protein
LCSNTKEDARAHWRGAGDALEENFELSDEGEGSGSEEEEDVEREQGLSKLEARRREQAKGDDELQLRFKSESAALLRKYGLETDGAGEPILALCSKNAPHTL